MPTFDFVARRLLRGLRESAEGRCLGVLVGEWRLPLTDTGVDTCADIGAGICLVEAPRAASYRHIGQSPAATLPWTRPATIAPERAAAIRRDRSPVLFAGLWFVESFIRMVGCWCIGLTGLAQYKSSAKITERAE